MLAAANRDVVWVNPQDPIERAVTLMLAHDYSKLAVMTGPHNMKGAISWKSIGSRLSQGNELRHVSDAMESAEGAPDTKPIFDVTRIIIQHDFIFVHSSRDNSITGIATATDLSEQFQGFSEPFLLLGWIEHQIRKLIENAFDVETLRAAGDHKDTKDKANVTSASQLTIGGYQRILEQEENWARLGFAACRRVFCSLLDEVRKLRNEIMHFHPDAIEDGDLECLRRFLRLLDELDRLSVRANSAGNRARTHMTKRSELKAASSCASSRIRTSGLTAAHQDAHRGQRTEKPPSSGRLRLSAE